jgi:S-adenosylmethionine synthetase
MRPKAIIERFGLKNPIYSETAAYGHMGREPYEKEVTLHYVNIEEKGNQIVETRTSSTKKVQFFGWEKLDFVDKLKQAFQ